MARSPANKPVEVPETANQSGGIGRAGSIKKGRWACTQHIHATRMMCAFDFRVRDDDNQMLNERNTIIFRSFWLILRVRGYFTSGAFEVVNQFAAYFQ